MNDGIDEDQPIIDIETTGGTEPLQELAAPTALPVDPPKKPREPDVSDAQIDEAVDQLSLRAFKLTTRQGYRAKAIIGRYSRQLGIVDIGRGQLAVAEGNIEKIMATITGEIAGTADAFVKSALLNLLVSLNKQLVEIAQTNIKGTAAGGNGQVPRDQPAIGFPMGIAVMMPVKAGK